MLLTYDDKEYKELGGLSDMDGENHCRGEFQLNRFAEPINQLVLTGNDKLGDAGIEGFSRH